MLHNNVIFKGQEISDGNFGVFNSFKKTYKGINSALQSTEFVPIRGFDLATF